MRCWLMAASAFVPNCLPEHANRCIATGAGTRAYALATGCADVHAAAASHRALATATTFASPGCCSASNL